MKIGTIGETKYDNTLALLCSIMPIVINGFIIMEMEW